MTSVLLIVLPLLVVAAGWTAWEAWGLARVLRVAHHQPEARGYEIVARAMAGKMCVLCRQPMGDPAFLDHYTALLASNGTTVPWPDISPALLREALSTLPPVCWDCHIAETFRRLHPELVTDRPWPH